MSYELSRGEWWARAACFVLWVGVGVGILVWNPHGFDAVIAVVAWVAGLLAIPQLFAGLARARVERLRP